MAFTNPAIDLTPFRKSTIDFTQKYGHACCSDIMHANLFFIIYCASWGFYASIQPHDSSWLDKHAWSLFGPVVLRPDILNACGVSRLNNIMVSALWITDRRKTRVFVGWPDFVWAHHECSYFSSVVVFKWISCTCRLATKHFALLVLYGAQAVRSSVLVTRSSQVLHFSNASDLKGSH